MLFYKLKTPYNPGDLDPGVTYDYACVCDLRAVNQQLNVLLVLGTVDDGKFVQGKVQPTSLALRNVLARGVENYDKVKDAVNTFAEAVLPVLVELDPRWQRQ